MKRVQNPQVCHGHSRPIVELAYRWVLQGLRRFMVNMKASMLSYCSSMVHLYHDMYPIHQCWCTFKLCNASSRGC